MDIAVIDIVKARLVTISGTAPLIETLNARPATALPAKFLTLRRDFSSVHRIGIGPSPYSAFREIGTFTIVVTCQSGAGPDDAEVLATTVRDLFHNYDVVHFHVTVVDSPSVGTPDNGNWFQLEVPVQYQYDFFK